MTYQEQLDKNRIPQHVAIIMDGNGRWAEQRGKDRTEGHAKGVEVVKKIVSWLKGDCEMSQLKKALYLSEYFL